jgi:hypothetical protein
LNGIKKLTGCRPVILFEPSHYWLSEVSVEADDIARLQQTIFNDLVGSSREGKECFNRMNDGNSKISDLDDHYRKLMKTPKHQSKEATLSTEATIIDSFSVKQPTSNVSIQAVVVVVVVVF